MSLSASCPVLSCAEAGAWEKKLLRDETAEWDAMQRAGAAIAAAILDDFLEIGGLPVGARLLVLTGKGHNGGDALLATAAVLEKFPGATVDLLFVFGEEPLKPLAKLSLEVLRKTAGLRLRVVTPAQLKTELASYDVCLDGTFGFQFHPPLDDATAELLAWVNTHPRIRLRAAVDLPSGVGEANAGTIFRADFTYATGIVKSPLLVEGNAPFVGRVRYLDLGFFGTAHPEGSPYQVGRGVPAAPSSPDRVLEASILTPLARLRSPQSDKRTYGHLIVVGGSRSYPGAVLMTVQAALRSGVGLLTAFVPTSLAPTYATHFPEAMWVGLPETSDGGLALAGLDLVKEKLSRANVLAIGPGLGAEAETIQLVCGIVGAAAGPGLLDADALRPEVLAAAKGKRFVCTPHAGEFQRMAGAGVLREFAGQHGAVVVLKGPVTRVCGSAVLQLASDPDARGPKHRATPECVYHSLFGGPVLARGGSGDVLAGLIGGLLAQEPDDLLLAAARGVVWHGLAADLLARDKGQVAVQTTQLFDYLQPALRFAKNAP